MNCKKPQNYLIILLLCFAFFSGQAQYTADWESLDTHPAPDWYQDAKFGIFIHWGVYAVPAYSPVGEYSEWYWRHLEDDSATIAYHNATFGPEFEYQDFADRFDATLFDAGQWAELFRKSGAKYVVPTSKHHDGFCLWPSKEANESWGRPWNAVDVGPKRDIMEELSSAVRKEGLEFGFYYSLWEWYNPIWKKDKATYVEQVMTPQFKEVVSKYKPSLIFSDGEWEGPDTLWKSQELLAWLYNLPEVGNRVIVNDRWGDGLRHKHGGYYTTEYGAGLPSSEIPWEENRGIGFSYGFNQAERLTDYKTSRELIVILADLVSRGGNLLLDVGPTASGVIPPIMEQRLLDMGKWLAVNGESIYGTRPWKKTTQWSSGKKPEEVFGHYRVKYEIIKQIGETASNGVASKQAFFTTTPNALYVTIPYLPKQDNFIIHDFSPRAKKVELLGYPEVVQWKQSKNQVTLDLSEIEYSKLPLREFDVYVYKISY